MTRGGGAGGKYRKEKETKEDEREREREAEVERGSARGPALNMARAALIREGVSAYT